MLVSKTHRIAFAHYPKTAGSSIVAWFREVFPDASYVDPAHVHFPVRTSLERLGIIPDPRRHHKVVRECLRPFRKLLSRYKDPERCDLRIIGVVREPFEMLVSLYEYWRRCDVSEEATSRLMCAARSQSFRTFVSIATAERQLPAYENFFDVGGPAWASTRLVDFASLEGGLAVVCQEFGVRRSATLKRLNVAPRRVRPVRAYVAEAGDLMFDVRRYFRWYYEDADALLVRGKQSGFLRAA